MRYHETANLLSWLLWYWTQWDVRQKINATAQILEGEVKRPTRLKIAFPALQWSADCDRAGMAVAIDQSQRQYPWHALDAEHLLLDVGIVRRGLGTERDVIIRVAFTKHPPWNECSAPGLFVIWLWNACLRANRPPAMPRLRQPRSD